MAINQYELVLLGPEKGDRRAELKDRVAELFAAMGLNFEADGRLLVGGATEPDWRGFPVAVWFGAAGAADSAELALMREFLDKGFTLFPVVAKLEDYSRSV